MKKILGLDLGISSIGWALVNEAEDENEKSSIIRLGVRVNPLTVDELSNFERGKSITTTADRTLKRSMRRNLQRYKLRREALIEILKENKFIDNEVIRSECGNRKTFETYRLRSRAVDEEITLTELARVFLMINKKRGYKSSRKAKSQDEGQVIDGMKIARQLYEENLTPGQLCLELLKSGKKKLPEFYRSDLQNEFDRIWNFQKEFYPDVLTGNLKDKLLNKTDKATWAICEKPMQLVGIKRGSKGADVRLENYRWRSNALTDRLDLEQLAIVLQMINGQIISSSGYLGSISDRSKELFFRKLTVGQYLMSRLDANPNESLRNQVFYRQDYIDEFNAIWEKQAEYHSELTDELKREIRDVIIFYQRRLKSQKGLISYCEFENRKIEIEADGKRRIITIGNRVIPRSSPLFQEFKIWQILNNVEVFPKGYFSRRNTSARVINGQVEGGKRRLLDQEEKELLFKELSVRENLSKSQALKLLFGSESEIDLNFSKIEGNRTFAALYKAAAEIIEVSGHEKIDFSSQSAERISSSVISILSTLGCDTEIFTFDSEADPDKQVSYRLWHLLYSYEGDNSKTGIDGLIDKISDLTGLEREYARILTNITFQDDYGSLSAKAIRKIVPYLKAGHSYDLACRYAGYRHSKSSLTGEEISGKVLKERLDILPKNSLRNPVVEKILNQMANVVNIIIDEYGKPDEIRVELARELKKNAGEREELSKMISQATRAHEEIKKTLQEEFGLSHVSRNDIIRYKLYKELETNVFKTLYSDTFIPREKIFSKEFDIEHIIPQARLFDDSFSNKTLEKGRSIWKKEIGLPWILLRRNTEKEVFLISLPGSRVFKTLKAFQKRKSTN
jgi:CRISPR-associated endonuclease Csn1